MVRCAICGTLVLAGQHTVPAMHPSGQPVLVHEDCFEERPGTTPEQVKETIVAHEASIGATGHVQTFEERLTDQDRRFLESLRISE